MFSTSVNIQMHFRVNLTTEANTMSPDRLLPKGSSLSFWEQSIWIHIVCNLDFQVYKYIEEKTTNVRNGGKRVNCTIDAYLGYNTGVPIEHITRSLGNSV